MEQKRQAIENSTTASAEQVHECEGDLAEFNSSNLGGVNAAMAFEGKLASPVHLDSLQFLRIHGESSFNVPRNPGCLQVEIPSKAFLMPAYL